MKVNVTVKPKNLNGKAIKIEDGDKESTLREICFRALDVADFKAENWKERGERFGIQKKLYSVEIGEVDLKSEEIATIKKCLQKTYISSIAGVCCDLLEPSSPPEALSDQAEVKK